MTTPSEESPPTKLTRGRWFKARVVLTVLLLIVGFTLYFNWRNGLPPRQIAILSQGGVLLHLPVMTAYTFPALEVPGFAVRTNLTLSGSSSVLFTWQNVTGGGLPVRFVLTPGDAFAADPAGGFRMQPAAGAVGQFAADRPGMAVDVVVDASLRYTLREMATYDWLGEDRWIEVDYGLTVVRAAVNLLPDGNATAPAAGDLLPVGNPVRASYAAGVEWTYGLSVHAGRLPSAFRNALPAVVLDAGGQGRVSAALVAFFAWGASDDYRLSVGGSGPANLSFQVYVDARFGSLLAVPVP